MTQTAETVFDSVRQFATGKLKPIARELDVQGRFPEELLADMRSLGLFGLNYPEEFGGGGLDSVATHRTITELA